MKELWIHFGRTGMGTQEDDFINIANILCGEDITTTFKNLFTANPNCTSQSTTLSCSLSTSFGQQHLTVNAIPTTPNLTISISNINNSPYNDSLISANL